ncbi:LysR family transcriptional regulator [Cupriavidus basilensis OR16]|uniref:LysR family transcriptional regulator n=1 Tax=Cupriavidus basilensis OR16 TaxID=1127483 RepID=H1S8W3_9BURK|nr:LysR family transcriptional regulator [Cupriavidus basilensis OR16]
MSQSHRLQSTALRYFLEVVRCGSISEAALRLNVAGSAVSRQIAGLEETLDVVLFERRPRGMVLSAAGELLATHARKSSFEAERVVADVLALKGLATGHVRIASSEGFAIQFLPSVIEAFRAKHRGVRFQLSVDAPAEVTRRVCQGECDIGMVFNYSRVGQKDVKVEHRQPAPGLAIMRADHPLAKSRQVTLSQLQGYPMALPMALPDADTTVRQVFDIACIRQRVTVDPVLTSNYVETLLNFARLNDAITLASEVSVRLLLEERGLCAIPIRDRAMSERSIEVQRSASVRARTWPSRSAIRCFMHACVLISLMTPYQRSIAPPSAPMCGCARLSMWRQLPSGHWIRNRVANGWPLGIQASHSARMRNWSSGWTAARQASIRSRIAHPARSRKFGLM